MKKKNVLNVFVTLKASAWNVDHLYVVLIQCIEVFYVFTCMEYCAFIVAIFRIPSLEFSQASPVCSAH